MAKRMKIDAETAMAGNGDIGVALVEAGIPVGGKQVTISRPNFQVIYVPIVGTTYYCQQRFSEKSKRKMMESQRAGGARRRKAHDPRNFDDDFEACAYLAINRDGEEFRGIPSAAFKTAMVDATTLLSPKLDMKQAKKLFFVMGDGMDRTGGLPVEITRIEGEMQRLENPMKNTRGSTDIRVRAIWEPGWTAIVKIRFEESCSTPEEVINLLARGGACCGVGEGRPSSRNSTGCGWGTFDIDPNGEYKMISYAEYLRQG